MGSKPARPHPDGTPGAGGGDRACRPVPRLRRFVVHDRCGARRRRRHLRGVRDTRIGQGNDMSSALRLDTLREQIGTGDVDTVLVAFPDLQGRLMGKRVTGHYFLDHVAEGTGIEACNYLLAVDVDMTPVPGYRFANWEQGYGDMKAVPDLTTLRPVPWLEKTALVLCDLVDHETGTPVEVSPRRILQRQVERAAAAGYTIKIGSELEFFLFRDSYEEAAVKGYADLEPHSSVIQDYHLLQTTRDEYLIRSIRNAMDAAAVPVEFSKGEAGRGQHEINLEYADALEMADRHVIYKNGAKEIASLTGRSITFMAKYSMEEVGSSCHERDRPARERRDLLGAVLVDDVPVRHLERVGVLQVDLVLAPARLALRELDRDRGGVHRVADGTDQVLVPSRLQQVIVLDDRGVGLEIRVSLDCGFLVRVAEQEELELRTDLDRVSRGRRPLDLPLQDPPGRDLHRGAGLVIDEIAQHQRSLFEPRYGAQRREIGHGLHVAVALLPVGEPVAGHGRHVDVHGEQVVACLDAGALGDVVEEVVAGHALAHEPALEVGEGDEHRVDVASAYLFAKGVEPQRAAHVVSLAYSGVTYAAEMPPSTTSAAPVMNDESSQARNRAARAISAACPGRPIGMWTSRLAAHCGSAMSSARDRKSTRLNSSHGSISYAVFCLKKKKKQYTHLPLKNKEIKIIT